MFGLSISKIYVNAVKKVSNLIFITGFAMFVQHEPEQEQASDPPTSIGNDDEKQSQATLPRISVYI